MKKYIILILAVAWAASFSYAQNTLSAGVRLQFNVPASSSGTGNGNGGTIWVNKAISKRSNLLLSLGYQTYAGLGTGYIEELNRIGPTQVDRSIEASVLDALSFLTLDGAYRINATRSPLSFSLGFRLARRVNFKGEYRLQNATQVTFLQSGSVAPDMVDVLTNQINSQTGLLDESQLGNQLSTLDAGLQLGVHYQLSKGITAEATAYQGLLNQWVPEFTGEYGYWLTAFSLGLSARIF